MVVMGCFLNMPTEERLDETKESHALNRVSQTQKEPGVSQPAWSCMYDIGAAGKVGRIQSATVVARIDAPSPRPQCETVLKFNRTRVCYRLNLMHVLPLAAGARHARSGAPG